MKIFQAADILIPQTDSIEKWAVIACDQYTSQPEYWERVKNYTDGTVSTLNLILPEVDMDHVEAKVGRIHQCMEQYMKDGVFKTYENAYVYIERTLANGTIRKGVIGVVDLETYDYKEGSVSAIRATEKTVEERIPPRMNIRRNAPIELTHILMLCDDEKHMLIDSVEKVKEECLRIYDFDLMEGGGHLSGWLIQGEHTRMFDRKLEMYVEEQEKKCPMIFAVGDGNHSLATAKACYEELKQRYPNEDLSNHPARYALVELENIHDESQQFEPIHRIVTEIQAEALLCELKESICAKEGYPIVCYVGDKEETIFLNPELGELPIAILQKYLDEYLEKVPGKIDYIHGDMVVKELARKADSIGFLLPDIKKGQFFMGIHKDGVLPRKTFSMGHAQEKRYYLEARKIIR